MRFAWFLRDREGGSLHLLQLPLCHSLPKTSLHTFMWMTYYTCLFFKVVTITKIEPCCSLMVFPYFHKKKSTSVKAVVYFLSVFSLIFIFERKKKKRLLTFILYFESKSNFSHIFKNNYLLLCLFPGIVAVLS